MRVLVIACLLAGLVSAQEIPDAETGRSNPPHFSPVTLLQKIKKQSQMTLKTHNLYVNK